MAGLELHFRRIFDTGVEDGLEKVSGGSGWIRKFKIIQVKDAEDLIRGSSRARMCSLSLVSASAHPSRIPVGVLSEFG